MKEKVINIISTILLLVSIFLTAYSLIAFKNIDGPVQNGGEVVEASVQIFFQVMFLAISGIITLVGIFLSFFNLKSSQKGAKTYAIVLEVLFFVNLILTSLKLFIFM